MPASDSSLAGGCHCGAVRYEARGKPFHATICHCQDCRRVAGAPLVAWFSVRARDFHVVRGRIRPYASSSRAERGFCGDCGTPLTFRAHDLPEEIDVATATLDDPAAVPPADHVRVASGIPWAAPCDGLPQHREGRPQG
ncbi:GFA family protein [Pararoseomonas indoligenes]|uniref:GFA family protein n=1 Tax=Roseomonas indoligenes TaxID=2820811 RepID=A0A940MV64_9PROT|nr:GFA family protein [Pararoseomonas indoligenes]MBP0492576.1 GFA family protein [Pararoseomonas indoligenes]